MGIAYKGLRDFPNALRVTQQAHDMSMALGEEGIMSDTLAMGANLAVIYYESGDNEKALNAMIDNLEQTKAHFGPKHMNVLIGEYNVAEQMHLKGDYQTAIDMAQKTYVSMGEVFGVDHVYTKLNLDNWAVGLAGLGQLDAALEKHQEVVSAVQAGLGDEHDLTWLVIGHDVATL